MWTAFVPTLTLPFGPKELRLQFEPDELYRAPTDDGSAIALGRYLPRERRRFVEPVVLCHGLGANRFSLDFDERYSLARFLARRGFEAWVLELRGRGLAGPSCNATFDDQAEHDVRAALRTVRAAGANEVLWVGHSKGGLALLAHAVRNPQAPIRAAAVLGSPVAFNGRTGLARFVRRIQPFLQREFVPTARLASLALFGAPPGALARYLVEQDNIEPSVVRRALANLSSDIPGGVARQLCDWVTHDRFTSIDGAIDYRAGLGAFRVPTLVVAGSADFLAPPECVAPLCNLLGGPTEWVVAGKAQGFSADYGHADLVLGRRAPEEIFPRVERFLASHASPR